MPEDTRAAFALDALFRVVLWIWEVLAKWLDLVHLPLRQSPAPRAEPSHQVLKRTSEVAAIPPEDGKPPEALLDQSCADFAAAIRSRLSRGDVLAKSLYRQYYSSASLTDFPLPLDLSAAAEELTARILGLASLEPPLVFAGSDPTPPAPGATEKYVLRCTGGEEIEMVAMPAPGKDGAWSLCISSQVGCRMGCTFCETGKMGLLRNLTTGEIVAQVALAASTLGLRVGNIIFMGMGEPLDNVVAVIQAIKVLTDPHGLGVPLSHVTISTSGEAHHVPLLLKELPAIRIAFSLHAANDTLRSQLMPINRRVGLQELSAAMRGYLEHTKRRVTIQYVLLAGINDSGDHAEELASFLETVGSAKKLHVNLIPYNPQSGTPKFAAPDHESCKAFKTALQRHGLFTKIRLEKGAEKMAACGQLGNVRLRRELNARRHAEAEAAERAADEGEDEAVMDAVAEAAAKVQTAPFLSGTALRRIPLQLCGQKELEW